MKKTKEDYEKEKEVLQKKIKTIDKKVELLKPPIGFMGHLKNYK